jgi:hypothetical protein
MRKTLVVLLSIPTLCWAVGCGGGKGLVSPASEGAQSIKLARGSGGSTKGKIKVTSTPPGGRVFLDGLDTGLTTPTRPLRVDAGAHQVTVRKDGYEDCAKDMTVEPKKTAKVRCTLRGTDPPPSIYLEQLEPREVKVPLGSVAGLVRWWSGSVTMNGTEFPHSVTFAWGGSSEAVYIINGQYEQFEAMVGLNDDDGRNPGFVAGTTARFDVRGDGRLLASAAVQRSASGTIESQSLRCSLSGVRELRLVMVSSGGVSRDARPGLVWWGSAQLTKAR